MSGKTFRFNYDDLLKFENFVDYWGKEVRSFDNISMADDPDVLDTIQKFVKEQIRQNLVDNTSGANHRFGEFMAKRTQVAIYAKPKSFVVEVSGMTEHELAKVDPEAARISLDDQGTIVSKNYNLWAMYENGDFDGEGSDNKGGVRAQQKDVGAVLAIRKKSKDNNAMDGSKAGMIRSIMNHVRTEIRHRLQEAAIQYVKMAVAGAGEEAAKRAIKSTPSKSKGGGGKAKAVRTRNISRLPNEMRRIVAQADKEYEHELAKFGVRLVGMKGGQTRYQDIKSGRFTATVPTGHKERVMGRGSR